MQLENYDIPFVPTSDSSLQTMIKLANIRTGETACDLGAGEGKLVIAMGKMGAIVDGYEIDAKRAQTATQRVKAEGLDDRVRIYHQNFWNAPLNNYDVIMLFGITRIMPRLEKKIMKEGKKGLRVISNVFTFPNWKPKEKEDNILLYVKD